MYNDIKVSHYFPKNVKIAQITKNQLYFDNILKNKSIFILKGKKMTADTKQTIIFSCAIIFSFRDSIRTKIFKCLLNNFFFLP